MAPSAVKTARSDSDVLSLRFERTPLRSLFLEKPFSKAAEKGPSCAPPKPKIEAGEAQAITTTTVAQENTVERN